MSKKSKLILDKIDKEMLKDAIQGRKDYIEKELETYNSVQYKMLDMSLKNIKGLNWLVWVWAIPLIILGLPFLSGYVISIYIEKKLKTIFIVLKKLTYALIRDIKKFIKSKFGN
tara:strand:+ start:583 stop:924 length:342 start_codon:yes stop_codon:yes gene_type:complete